MPDRSEIPPDIRQNSPLFFATKAREPRLGLPTTKRLVNLIVNTSMFELSSDSSLPGVREVAASVARIFGGFLKLMVWTPISEHIDLGRSDGQRERQFPRINNFRNDWIYSTTRAALRQATIH